MNKKMKVTTRHFQGRHSHCYVRSVYATLHVYERGLYSLEAGLMK